MEEENVTGTDGVEAEAATAVVIATSRRIANKSQFATKQETQESEFQRRRREVEEAE